MNDERKIELIRKLVTGIVDLFQDEFPVVTNVELSIIIMVLIQTEIISLRSLIEEEHLIETLNEHHKARLRTIDHLPTFEEVIRKS